MNNGQSAQRSQEALRDSQQKRWRNVETILVIHDEPRSKWTVRRILESAGYDVITAASGPIAVNVLRTIKPGLVVADVRLQGRSGQDFVVRLDVNVKMFHFLY
jgi:DNA-binding response OmpR family regulator